MNDPVSAVTLLGVAIALAVLGYFIRFQRRLYLATSENSNYVNDQVTLAYLVGGLLPFIGILTAALAIGVALDWTTLQVWNAYALVVFISTVAVGVAGSARWGLKSAKRSGE